LAVGDVLDTDAIVERLRASAEPPYLAMLGRLNIDPSRSLGVRMPVLRAIAKELGKDHSLAQELWARGMTETMILAAMVDPPEAVTAEQMDSWVEGIGDWAVCDQTVGYLFRKTSYAHVKAREWIERDEEFVRRAGMVLMASLAVHDKGAEDGIFIEYLGLVEGKADDPRRYVMKAASWAVRQIGKRNVSLNQEAIAAAERIGRRDTRSARWIATDALRELRGEAVRARLTA
jgi:3-methyladenine DNA glycosylase AlkD